MQLSADKKFNVLHVITRLPLGGVENMLLKVVKGYNRERFRASVCCIKEGGEIAEELKRSGYNVEILNRMKGHGFDWGAVVALMRLIKREDVHIIRTDQYHANLYGRIAGILSKVPVIIPSYHNFYESPRKPKLHRRLLNHLLSYFTDTLIAVSYGVASDIKRYDWVSPEKIKVIYNGIVREEFNSKLSKQEARGIFGLPPHSLIIGSVGRMTEQKGHRYLIEAASGLRQSSVAIVGDGPLMGELRNLAESLGVNCFFLGRREPSKIPLFLRSLDIFCFPSLWEGFGVAIAEAMAAGLPIVATDLPPHREVMGDSGVLVPPGETERLREAVSLLIEDTHLRESLSEKARERSKLFSIERTVEAYETLFEAILKKKGLS